MPICDAYISEGALSPGVERELLGRITDLLLESEGVDPANETARMLAWVFVHRHQRRAAVTAAMTQAVVEAEDGSWPHPELRVAVFTYEVKDGTWGGGGRILRLPDIYEIAGEGREAAEQVLAERRRQEAELILAAAGERAVP